MDSTQSTVSGMFTACPDYDGPQDGCISCSRLEDENPCETLCLRFRTRLAAEEGGNGRDNTRAGDMDGHWIG